MKLKTSLTFLKFYHFAKNFYQHLSTPQKKPPDWVTSLGDYDEKKF